MSRRSAIVIPLQGGLGNQLFQLAAGLTLSSSSGRTVRFSDSWLRQPARGETQRALAIEPLLDPGEMTDDLAPRRISRSDLWTRRFVLERNALDTPLRRVRPWTRLIAGYFQDLEIVDAAWSSLAPRLRRLPLLATAMDSSDRLTGALHYRLGDYRTNPSARSHHGLISGQYFAEVIRRELALGLDRWRVISDEPELALHLIRSAGIPEEVALIAEAGANEWEDLSLLASAPVCVISNSSFSWWAALMGSRGHGARIVAPRPWYAKQTRDPRLFPAPWERMPRSMDAS